MIRPETLEWNGNQELLWLFDSKSLNTITFFEIFALIQFMRFPLDKIFLKMRLKDV